MNGNILKRDNLKGSTGTRREFFIVQNEILTKLFVQEHDEMAFALYCYIWRMANSNFNLTVDNLSNVTGVAKNTVRKSLQTLKKVGLIKEIPAKNIPDMPKVITTKAGRKVPNNSRKFFIYSALPDSGETAQQLMPGTFITDTEFTADEIQESESAQQVVAEFVEPQQERQERQKTPPPVEQQSRIPQQRNGKTTMAMERRKEKVCRIADSVQLFSSAGKEKLLYWLEIFKKEVGRVAEDEEIKRMAGLLSNNEKINLSAYISLKAQAESINVGSKFDTTIEH